MKKTLISVKYNDNTLVPMSQEEMPELASIPIDEMGRFIKKPDVIKVTGMDVGRAKAAAKDPGSFDEKRNNAYKYMLSQSRAIPNLGYDVNLAGNDILIHKLAA